MHVPVAPQKKSTLVFRPIALAIPIVAFLLGTAAAIVVACCRPAAYTGVYRQETVEVSAEASGKIVELASDRGATVRPGDSLVTLEQAGAAQEKNELLARRHDLERQLAEAKARAAVEVTLRIDRLEKERVDMQLRYADLLRKRFDVQLRKETLRRVARQRSRTSGDGAPLVPVSVETSAADQVHHQAEFTEITNHEQVLDTQITLCEERLAHIETIKDGIASQTKQSMGLDGIEADLDAVNAALKTLEGSAVRTAIASPAYGRVGVYRRNVGDFVSAGETIVEVFDSERPYILLTVPIGQLAELTPGRTATIEFDGIETRKALKGVVADVLSEAERNADAAIAPGVAVAHVRVTPVGRLWPTPPPGATAHVQLDSETADVEH